MMIYRLRREHERMNPINCSWFGRLRVDFK